MKDDYEMLPCRSVCVLGVGEDGVFGQTDTWIISVWLRVSGSRLSNHHSLEDILHKLLAVRPCTGFSLTSYTFWAVAV